MGTARSFVAVLGLAAGVVTALSISPAGASADTVTTTRYVSTIGKGTACTRTSPCNLPTAQSQVRAATAHTLTRDLVVQLAGGTYGGPLSFDASDSGNGGHVVRYQSAPGQRAVVSGGRVVTGWSLQNASKNIWQASVPTGFTGRQLYVNGRRAQLAWGSTSDVLGSLTPTLTGYRVANPAIASWYRPQDVEFVYPAGGYDPSLQTVQSAPWTWNLCSVSSVSGTTVTMESGCWRNGRGYPSQQNGRLTSAKYPTISVPTYVRNNYALLSEPGEFYLDSAQGKLYYIPRAGENLETAAVVLAHQQELLTATGTAGRPVHDLQFVGLTFEYGTYVPDKLYGLVNLEGNLFEYAMEKPQTGYVALAALPSNVSFVHAQRILFENNVLTHLGADGVSFSGGGSANSVIGNVVTDVSGSGISIGDMLGIDTPNSYESATVSNNYVHDVADEYESGSGIIVGWSRHTSVTHNEVSDVYMGIQLGSGSLRTDNVAGDNHIDDNYVHDVHSTSLRDGGAIYTTGWQAGSPNSTITGNYISGDANIYGAIYLDGVSAHWTVSDNVVEHVASTSGWLFVQNLPLDGGLSDTAKYNTVTSNYTDTARRVASIGKDDPSNTIASNQVGLTTWPAVAESIMSTAGLTGSWQGIRGGDSIVNLAYRRPVVVTSNAAMATKAADGDVSSTWVSETTDQHPGWETDLGAAKSLTKINVLTRQDVGQPSAQDNFQIWVSNTPTISATSILACSQGADHMPFRETFACDAPAGRWRYVALIKTDGMGYSVAEVQVFGHS